MTKKKTDVKDMSLAEQAENASNAGRPVPVIISSRNDLKKKNH